MTRLRAGVVGLGWAGETHARAYAALPHVDLVAIAGLERERREELARELEPRHAFESWEDIVSSDDIDVVSVCTPNRLHAPVSIAALERGKHVLCEKPLATSIEDAQSMVAAAREANRVLQAVFNVREHPAAKMLAARIRAGDLGRIYHTKAAWLRRSGVPHTVLSHGALLGGGPLLDLGVHMLDLALHLMDEPVVSTVSACTHAELCPRGIGFGWEAGPPDDLVFDVEDYATALLRFESGSTLLLETSWASHAESSSEVEVTLLGTEGGARLRWDGPESTLDFYSVRDGVNSTEHVDLTSSGKTHLAVVSGFVEIVLSGSWSHQFGEIGLERTRLIAACYASAREGREIDPTLAALTSTE